VRDWVGNLNAVRVSYNRPVEYSRCDGCKVHSGFHKVSSSVSQVIVDEVKRLLNRFPDYKLVVTGHSLGGAVATLLALDLYAKGNKNVQLITFGSPRVGNTRFAKAASRVLKNSYRFTHNRDIVPHLPPHKPPLTYTHLSGEYFEDASGRVTRCEGHESMKCSYKYWKTNVNDHMTYLGVQVNAPKCPVSRARM
jgi:thioesterase domain-containing protein